MQPGPTRPPALQAMTTPSMETLTQTLAAVSPLLPALSSREGIGTAWCIHAEQALGCCNATFYLAQPGMHKHENITTRAKNTPEGTRNDLRMTAVTVLDRTERALENKNKHTVNKTTTTDVWL